MVHCNSVLATHSAVQQVTSTLFFLSPAVVIVMMNRLKSGDPV